MELNRKLTAGSFAFPRVANLCVRTEKGETSFLFSFFLILNLGSYFIFICGSEIREKEKKKKK